MKTCFGAAAGVGAAAAGGWDVTLGDGEVTAADGCEVAGLATAAAAEAAAVGDAPAAGACADAEAAAAAAAAAVAADLSADGSFTRLTTRMQPSTASTAMLPAAMACSRSPGRSRGGRGGLGDVTVVSVMAGAHISAGSSRAVPPARARRRVARNRRSRLTSMGSATRAAGESIRAFSIW